jgi:hypothetical protein
LPFNARVLLSSEESKYAQSMNSFSFNFDAQTFRSNLQQKAQNIADGKQQEAKALFNEKINVLKEHSRLDRLFNNPEVQKELNYINKADSIRNLLENPDLSDELRDSLSGVLSILSTYESKKKSYERLMQRKSELDSLKNVYSTTIDSIAEIKEIDYSTYGDMRNIRKQASSLGLSRAERYFASVSNLFIGTGFPNYSMLTLQGQAVKGFSVDVDPGIFYASATHGRLKRSVVSPDINRNSYERKITAGGIGMGNVNSNHFRLFFLTAEDDPLTMSAENISSAYTRPQSNQVLSLSGNYEIVKSKLSINAEIAGSQHNRDVDAINTNGIYVDSTQVLHPGNPELWLYNIFRQKQIDLYNATDYSYNVGLKSSLLQGRTNISTNIKRVGPYFESFGLPFLYRDMKTYDFEVGQSLLKNILNIKLGGNYSHNKLPRSTAFASQLINGNASLGIRIPKFPSLNFAYKPMYLTNDSLNFRNDIINVNSSYNYKIKNINQNTIISYLNSSSRCNIESLKFNSEYYMINHYMSFENNVSVNFSVAYNILEAEQGKTDDYIDSLAGGAKIFKINNMLGLNYSTNKYENY